MYFATQVFKNRIKALELELESNQQRIALAEQSLKTMKAAYKRREKQIRAEIKQLKSMTGATE